MMYHTPVTYRVIDNWPYGATLKTQATFQVEVNKQGQRVVRTMINPKNGQKMNPKKTTYARKCCIVTGDDNKTYILELTRYGSISVMQGNMQYSQEYIMNNDERFSTLLSYFQQG